MGKQAEKNKVQEKAERKLDRARIKFEVAHEHYLLVREQGKQQVEKAQLQADRKLTKINEELQKRAQALSRAEERVRALDFGKGFGSVASDGVFSANDAALTPDRVADAIQELQVERSDNLDGNDLSVPHAVQRSQE